MTQLFSPGEKLFPKSVFSIYKWKVPSYTEVKTVIVEGKSKHIRATAIIVTKVLVQNIELPTDLPRLGIINNETSNWN